jgi:hypothetical protein
MPDPFNLGPRLVDEIERELQSCNTALQRLGRLVSSDGIDPTLLAEFREAVNRVRVTAWAAEKSIADREGVSIERLLAAERVRNITKMLEQVSEYVGCHELADCPDFEKLLQEITKLTVTIRLKQTEINPRPH